MHSFKKISLFRIISLFILFVLFFEIILDPQCISLCYSDDNTDIAIRQDVDHNYFYIDSKNEIKLLADFSSIPYYANACTEYWNNMPNSYLMYCNGLTLDQQKHNAFYIEYLLIHKGLGKNKKKWTRQAAAALIGNLIEESDINPGQWERWMETNTKQSGYGLCQWTPSKTFFKNNSLTATKANKLVRTNPKKMLSIQLSYLWKTMTTKDHDLKMWYIPTKNSIYKSPLKLSAQKYIKSKKSAGKLAKVFCVCYLRPGDIDEQFKRRSKRANDWYKNRIVKEKWDD